MRFSPGWGRLRVPYFAVTKRLSQKTQRLSSLLFRSLSNLERGLLVVFMLGALVSGTQLAWGSDSVYGPDQGGVYREGILGASVRDLEPLDAALTKIGLLKLNTTGTLEPNLATEWTVDEGAQTIRIRIRDEVSAESVVDTLTSQTGPGYWKEAEIHIHESQVIEFHLSKPWAGFVTELVQPIFPHGPFQKTTSDKSDVVRYTENPTALFKPYISEVELHLYADSKTLDRAIRKNTINGVFTTETTELTIPNNWTIQTPSLFREHVLFLNVRTETLSEASIRQKLARGERLNSPITLRLAVPENSALSPIAYDLAARWSELNVEVLVEEYPLLTLTKTVIPERNYDLILLGLDYGPDGDLYPYWHSSQIAAPGNNLAGYRNKEIDRLLEETRTISDQAERKTRYEAARQILSDQAVFISFGSPTVTVALSPDVHGDVPERLEMASSRWTDIANWYMKEKRIRKVE